jgi:hypothetical protein
LLKKAGAIGTAEEIKIGDSCAFLGLMHPYFEREGNPAMEEVGPCFPDEFRQPLDRRSAPSETD